MSSLRSPDHHLVFSQLIDVFLRKGAASLITPQIREAIKVAGIDLSKPLDPAYPASLIEDVLEVIAVRGLPGLSRSEALQHIGRLQLRAFTETVLGRATVPFFKLYARDPERVLKLLSRGFRQANNYVETRTEKQGPGHYRVWFNDAGRLPEIFQGTLEEGTELLEFASSVRIFERKGLECWYELRARA